MKLTVYLKECFDLCWYLKRWISLQEGQQDIHELENMRQGPQRLGFEL